jgi:hypothetical protein
MVRGLYQSRMEPPFAPDTGILAHEITDATRKDRWLRIN